VAVNGAAVEYEPVFWGDVAAKFRWNLTSRPKTALRRAGGNERFAGLGSLREAGTSSPLDTVAPATVVEGPVLNLPAPAGRVATPPLASIPRANRPDFLADLYLAVRPRRRGQNLTTENGTDPIVEDPSLAALADAAASVAADWDHILADQITEDARAAQLVSAIESKLSGDALLRQGGFEDWMTKAGETLKRATLWPADAVSTVFAELRPVAHEFIAYFIGDVLAYLNQREAVGRAGEIPTRLLGALQRAHERKQRTGEKIIVVTHSMGGQLFYDAITFFASADRRLAGIEIDHWISCGAQVSFFAELGLFRGQSDVAEPQKLPRPDHVKAWTNYYDRNDLVGFIMAPVFDGVVDLEYDTGYGLAFAHTGFLARPSFFQAVANRL
jgi:hypothetical protein